MKKSQSPLTTELLILPDGRILVHNLTQPFAELLHELNPGAEQISSRLSRRNAVKADATRPPLLRSSAAGHPSLAHELPD